MSALELAWNAGFADARYRRTYDCRAFFPFDQFTAYEHGWGVGWAAPPVAVPCLTALQVSELDG